MKIVRYDTWLKTLDEIPFKIHAGVDSNLRDNSCWYRDGAVGDYMDLESLKKRIRDVSISDYAENICAFADKIATEEQLRMSCLICKKDTTISKIEKRRLYDIVFCEVCGFGKAIHKPLSLKFDIDPNGLAPSDPGVGIKYDNKKVRYDLVPPEAETAIANVLTFGSYKYGDRNWEKGIDEGRLLAAVRGHINDHQRGQIYDRETNLPHTWHALCDLAMIVSLNWRKTETSDDYSCRDYMGVMPE